MILPSKTWHDHALGLRDILKDKIHCPVRFCTAAVSRVWCIASSGMADTGCVGRSAPASYSCLSFYPKTPTHARGVNSTVRSDIGACGMIFTLDTESGLTRWYPPQLRMVLAKPWCRGAVNPDEFYIYKPALKQNARDFAANLRSQLIRMQFAASLKPVGPLKH